MNPRFAISRPCPKTWAELQGDGRRRYCVDCHKHVHAIDEYSEAEWSRIWRESNGHACGMLCGESAPEPRSRRVVLFGALLTAIAPLMAQTGRARIRVLDPTGAAVPGAEISLLNSDKKPVRSLLANPNGEVDWTDLPMGNLRFQVSCPGFKTRPVTIILRDADEIKVDAVLELGPVTIGLIIGNPKPKRRWWPFR